jgi:hypothetical protein
MDARVKPAHDNERVETRDHIRGGLAAAYRPPETRSTVPVM